MRRGGSSAPCVSAASRSIARSTTAVLESPVALASRSTFATTTGLAICSAMVWAVITIYTSSIYMTEARHASRPRLVRPRDATMFSPNRGGYRHGQHDRVYATESLGLDQA